MSEVTQRIVAAYEALGRAVQESLIGNGSEAVPEPTPEPDEFKHTDHGDDTLRVVPGSRGNCLLSVNSCADHVGVHLDQDAVNRLAQYLDQHRTDTPCPTNAVNDNDCAGTRGHDGPCTPNADDIGAPCRYVVRRGVRA